MIVKVIGVIKAMMYRSGTNGAERLFVTGPALSQQIGQLEAELGTRLFDRLGREVRLTAAGRIFAQHAQRVLRELDDARVALDDLAGLQRGTLAVGVVQTVNASLLPRVVAAFTTAYPAIHVLIEERTADAIEAGLLDGTLQVGISFVPATAEDIATEALFSEELQLIVREDHPLATYETVRVGDLDGVALALLSTAFCTRRLWERSVAQAGVRPQVVIEMNTVGSLLATVRTSGLATVLPALALHDEQASGLAGIRLTDPTPRRTVGLMWARRAYQCATASAFMATVRAVSVAQ